MQSRLKSSIDHLVILLITSFCAISILLAYNSDELPKNSLISYASYLENTFSDYRKKYHIQSDAKDNRIVLVSIDDQTITKIGKWPLERKYYAQLLNKLYGFGARVVSFDIFFSEENQSCSLENHADTFSSAISRFQEKEGNHVILPYKNEISVNSQDLGFPDILFNNILETKLSKKKELIPFHVDKGVFPIDRLLNSLPSLGHINSYTDSDGVFRNFPFVTNVDGFYLPSFATVTYMKYTNDNVIFRYQDKGAPYLSVKSGDLYLNNYGESKIKWSGGEDFFPTIPLWKLLNAPNDNQKMHNLFSNKIVFIGSTAKIAHDYRSTSIFSEIPGVYAHMNMVKMLLDGDFYQQEKISAYHSWSILLITSLLFILIHIYFANPIINLSYTSFTLAFIFFYDRYFLYPQAIDANLFFCTFNIIFCYIWTTAYNLYFSNKEKVFLNNTFKTYISKELIDEILRTGKRPKLGGNQSIQTALFTNIVSFSKYARHFSTEKLIILLNEYLTSMTDVLFDEKGTLDKYEGGGIVAFFGAPLPLDDHATRACVVACKMQKKLKELRQHWKNEANQWPELVHDMKMTIGINTGEIVTGNMGSSSRMNYTMIGDAVNLAARLQASAIQYGVFIHVSQTTKIEAKEGFLWRELDNIKVVGKEIPVKTYELLCLMNNAPEELIKMTEMFEKALELYRNRDFNAAINVFKKTLQFEDMRYSDLNGTQTNPSEVYIKRCQKYLESPPSNDWIGVTTLTDK